MGRAIKMEQDIDTLTMEINKLRAEIGFLKETVSQILELAKGDDSEKAKPKKKATKAKDRAKDGVSDK